MRLLITGITGFVGSHMAEYAISRGAEVIGSVRWRSRTENIEHLQGQLRLIECDLRDTASVRRLLAASVPTHVIHLAAQSFVGASWHMPGETLSTNMTSQLNLLEGIREFPDPPRFLAIGTSEEYGLVYPDELPIRETNPLRPLSPYAVSKVGQDLMGFQYFQSYGLPIVRTRAFNHEGPRRGDVFVTSNFAKQVAEIEAGRHDPSSTSGISRRGATIPTCATSFEATGCYSSTGSRARCTTSARAGLGRSSACSTSTSTDPRRRGFPCRSTPRDCARPT